MKWRIPSPSRESRVVPSGRKPFVLLLADRQAEVGPRIDAVDALAALRREEGDDVVPRRERGDVGAHALDDAGALVAEHGGRIARRVGAGGRVEVGVADAACDKADERLAGPRLGQLDLLDRQRLPKLLQHGGAHLHRRDATTEAMHDLAGGMRAW
jgi:hypothetical protein